MKSAGILLPQHCRPEIVLLLAPPVAQDGRPPAPADGEGGTVEGAETERLETGAVFHTSWFSKSPVSGAVAPVRKQRMQTRKIVFVTLPKSILRYCGTEW